MSQDPVQKVFVSVNSDGQLRITSADVQRRTQATRGLTPADLKFNLESTVKLDSRGQLRLPERIRKFLQS